MASSRVVEISQTPKMIVGPQELALVLNESENGEQERTVYIGRSAETCVIPLKPSAGIENEHYYTSSSGGYGLWAKTLTGVKKLYIMPV